MRSRNTLGAAAAALLAACGSVVQPPAAQTADPGMPCVGTAAHVFEACGCNPVESRLLTRAKTLDVSIRTATRDCLGVATSLNVLTVEGELEACVSRSQALDPGLSAALAQLVVESSAAVTEPERDQWLSCYERAVARYQGQGATAQGQCGAGGNIDVGTSAGSGLSVRSLVIRGGRPATVCPGSSVRSGEYMFLELSLRTDAYVHVAAISPDRQAQVLFPEREQSRLLRGGTPMRVPPRTDQAFQLDATTGTETLLVVASKRPLVQSDRGAAELFAYLRSNGHLPADVTLAPDAGASRGGGGNIPGRGLHRVDLDAQAVYSQFDEDGVIIVPITFQHVD